jgi:RNA polymerase sigma-70 factor (ECF subfamily)
LEPPATNTREDRAAAAERRLHALIGAAMAGDALAYRDFLGLLAGHLRAYFRRRLAGLPDEVEDLVQETLIAVHNQRATYDPRQPLTAWAYAIARHKLVDLLRRRAGRDALHDPFDDASELFATRDDEAHQARRDVAVLLGRLPERQRRPIVLVKLEGRSVDETAALTGMSASAVKVNVHRGLKALARLMRDDEDR